MRNIGLILRRELGSYLRTPSGYIIAALALLVDGVFFNALAVGSQPRLSTEVLQEFLLWAGRIHLVAAVMVSFRLLAEERATGTQVLLFTSPIREGEIVVGKFLASLIFLSILALLSIYLPALIFVNGKVSWGHIAAGYIGLVLLMASILSVGVFASALVKHQLLAVVVAGAFVAMLELCWVISQISDPPLNTLIAYFAPFSKHYTPFIRGLVQMSDIVYHASVVFFCLLAATRVLKSQRWQ
jgi:ABC-2 type transport system permease protein